MLFKAKVIILFLFLIYHLNIQANVTIGLNEDPAKAALLDLKDQVPDENNVTATKGGFLLPRVQLIDKNELAPFIASASDEEKRLHEGLLIYNLTQNSSKGLESGLNYWDGKQWNALEIKNAESIVSPPPTEVVDITSKRIVAFGDITYGLTSGSTSGARSMISNNMNFGTDPNSIVNFDGFTDIKVETAMTNSNIAKYTGADGSTPYDIILISYPIAPTEQQNHYLKNYVDQNGVLLLFSQQPISATAIIDSICSASLTSAHTVGMLSSIYHLNKIADIDDEITNGPFGDVRNLAWGCDFANTIGVTVVPENMIVYSSNINAATNQSATGTQANVKATMFRHPTKNFFWCGDGGFIHGGTSTTATDTPLWVGSINKTVDGQTVNYPIYPIAKPNYGSNHSSKMNVYNSVLFANIMAWALQKAETNGINTL